MVVSFSSLTLRVCHGENRNYPLMLFFLFFPVSAGLLTVVIIVTLEIPSSIRYRVQSKVFTCSTFVCVCFIDTRSSENHEHTIQVDEIICTILSHF